MSPPFFVSLESTMSEKRDPLLTKKGFEQHIANIWWNVRNQEKHDVAPWFPETANGRKAYLRNLNLVDGEMVGPSVRLVEFMVLLDKYAKRHKAMATKKKGKKNVR